MRIVFDCFKQVKGSGKSIGIYNQVLNTLRNMVREQQTTSDERIRNAKLIVIGNPLNRKDFRMKGLDFVCIRDLDPTNKVHALWWELFRVVRECRRLRADRVVFPRGFSALIHPFKDTVLIHDMIPFYYDENYPGYFNRIENAYIMKRLIQSARGAQRIVTVSEASKRDIIRYTLVDCDKITVLYNGCNQIEMVGSPIAKDGAHYIVAVTSLFPHKNAEGVIKGYKSYFESVRDPLDLVIIGIEKVDAYSLSPEILRHIRCYRYIESDAELHEIIGGADIFLFLSLAEGFGFPPIEAMQLGVPVVCSDRGSLPEIVGDAALTVNPDDPDEVGKQLSFLAGSENERARLVQKGDENIRRFSWEVLAGKYWEEYLR